MLELELCTYRFSSPACASYHHDWSLLFLLSLLHCLSFHHRINSSVFNKPARQFTGKEWTASKKFGRFSFNYGFVCDCSWGRHIANC